MLGKRSCVLFRAFGVGEMALIYLIRYEREEMQVQALVTMESLTSKAGKETRYSSTVSCSFVRGDILHLV